MTENKQYAVRMADGTLVGPLTIKRVKQLLREGQLSQDDRLAIIGKTFRPISMYPELQFIHPNERPLLIDTEDGVVGAFDLLDGIPPMRVFFPDKEETSGPQSATHSGNLDRVPFARLLYSFHAYQRTGRVLLLNHKQETREVYFSRGLPVQGGSSEQDQDLSERLIHKHVCTQEQVSKGRDRLSQLGGQLGDHLIALGYLDPYLLFEVLQEQFRDYILEIFNWFNGRYFFFTDEEAPSSGIPFRLDCYEILKQGIYSSYDLGRLRYILEPFYNRSLQKTSNPLINVESLRLSSQEARVYNLIDQAKSLWDLNTRVLQTGVMDDLGVHKFIFFLGQIELVLFNNEYLGEGLQDEIPLLPEKSVPV